MDDAIKKLIELRAVYARHLEQSQQNIKQLETQLTQAKNRGLQLQGAVSALDDATGLLGKTEIKRKDDDDEQEE